MDNLMFRALALGVAVTLAGCGGGPIPPSALVPPAKRCMVPPPPIERLSAGDDLVVKYAGQIRAAKANRSKVVCLQKWVRVVTAKK